MQVSVGPVSPSWLEKNSSKIQDWVEDVEQGDAREHHRSDAESFRIYLQMLMVPPHHILP